MIERVVTAAVRAPRLVVVSALALAVLFAAIGASLLPRMGTDSGSADAQSLRVVAVLDRAAGYRTQDTVVALVESRSANGEPAGRTEAAEVASLLATIPGVAKVAVTSPDRQAPQSRPGSPAALVTARVASGADVVGVADAVRRALRDRPGVQLTGSAVVASELTHRVRDDLGRAELISLPVLFLLALWIFRSAVAAAVTVAVGVLTILTTLAVLRGIVEVTPLAAYVLNLVTGLGLGLSIDYCLFVISRYREESARHGHTPAAVIAATVRAGRTVVFSALTVAAAMLALTLFPERFLSSMGVGGAVVTAAAATTAVTVLPAVLTLVGARIDSLALPGARRARERDTGDVHVLRWYRLAAWVTRHAAPVFLASVVSCALLAWPALGTRFSNIDIASLPADSPARVVGAQVGELFPGTVASPITIALLAPPNAPAAQFAARVATLPQVRLLGPPTYLGRDTWQLSAAASSGPFTAASTAAVAGIRRIPFPGAVMVGGESAVFVDVCADLRDHLPLALVLVGLSVLIVIFLLTGSVVLAAKTLIVNTVNVAVTVGVLVWIFQDGHLSGLLNFTPTGTIDLSQPIMVMVLSFGLSTDYAVFLLARIKESYDRLGAEPGTRLSTAERNAEAVAVGVGRSGRIISSAAILLAVAVGAFSSSSLLFIKQLGVGTVIAVIFDSTVIRALLVPSAMRLMSSANWYAPGWLSRSGSAARRHRCPADPGRHGESESLS